MTPASTWSAMVLCTMAFATGAEAQDRSAWFKSLKMPGTGMPCCDVADCVRTRADWQGGQWWADVQGKWSPIPREKEIGANSIDGDAYICIGPSGFIFCFVKPSLPM